MKPSTATGYGKLARKTVPATEGPAATTMESMRMEAERKKKAAAMLAASRMANPKTVLGG